MGATGIGLLTKRKSRLKVAIIAAGQPFQNTAAWAAATYTRYLPEADSISVFLPNRERATSLLKTHSRKFSFKLETFPFASDEERDKVTQIKLQAFLHITSLLSSDELAFLVDADTCCCRPLKVERKVQDAVLGGQIGFVPDVEDRHGNEPGKPGYLKPRERAPYVNSGVVLVSRQTTDIFASLLEISKEPGFAHTIFWDQTVINFALGKHYRDRLLLLSRDYNEIFRHHSPTKYIDHYAGQPKSMHAQSCANVLAEMGIKIAGGGVSLKSD